MRIEKICAALSDRARREAKEYWETLGGESKIGAEAARAASVGAREIQNLPSG